MIAKSSAGDLLKNIIRMPAGTEPGVFMQKFPQLKDKALGIGAVITEAHTPRESMNVKSFKDATTALQKVIEGFAKDASLLR